MILNQNSMKKIQFTWEKFIDSEGDRQGSHTAKIKLLNIKVLAEGGTFSLKGIFQWGLPMRIDVIILYRVLSNI